MEWGARQLANAVIGDVADIRRQRPNPDARPTPYGGTSYHDRFIPWMSSFPVAIEDRWFPGPVSHPYPGVSSCRTDPALQGQPRIPVAGLPDCEDAPWGDSLSPVTTLGGNSPGLSTDTFESLGVPIPENYSAPSTTGLEDTVGVHMQAFRLGDILFTVCSCEQWVDQAYNIKTRTDTLPGNEYLGYDATSPDADPSERCTKNGDGSWDCSLADLPAGPVTRKLPGALVDHMRAQVLNDAAGWDDPTCKRLGCGLQAESEPTDPSQVFGNYTHDDTTVRGGKAQSDDYARDRGYKLTVTISMANDYNGYIATYREYMNHDHYRKALTGWGPHSSDYYATRLSQLGHALKGDDAARHAVDGQTDPQKADPAWAAMVAKEVGDQAQEEAKVRAVGEAASAGVKAYAQTLPDDGGTDAELVQPKSIRRFDATTFTWDGGNNYTDNPEVTVERKDGSGWVPFADQSGEVPVTLKYPAAGGQVWKWTATFEAFVSRFRLVDPAGRPYTATPAGTYRFVVHGRWRKGNADKAYTRISNSFEVKPWNGITVEDAHVDGDGHVSFAAGPAHELKEQTVRHTARPAFNPGNAPVAFRIGPVDFPDAAADRQATGARFLDLTRGYSGTGMDNVEHYCLDCSFRPWLDATGDLTATIVSRGHRERLNADSDGRFRSRSALPSGATATITIEDAWGDTTTAPATVNP